MEAAFGAFVITLVFVVCRWAISAISDAVQSRKENKVDEWNEVKKNNQ